jgi:hypothetical protein
MTFKQIFALHPKPTDLDHEILCGVSKSASTAARAVRPAPMQA